MGLARVVAFDRVGTERMEEQTREIQEGERTSVTEFNVAVRMMA